MNRRGFITLLGGRAAAAWPLAARAQQRCRLPRDAVLVVPSTPFPLADVFCNGLPALGYLEGRTIALAFRYTMGRADLAVELAAELVRLPCDVIVTHWTQATRAAMAATKT